MSEETQELQGESTSPTGIIPADPGVAAYAIQPADMSQLPSFWGFTPQHLEGIRRAKAIQNMRHGLLSNVPMICKDRACPFIKACYIPEDQRVFGSRCPIEIATVISRYESYAKHLEVSETDVVDLGLIKELVSIEVQMARADMKLAISPDVIEEVVAAVDSNGQPLMRPEINKAIQLQSELRRERHRILDLLNSTRKNRAKESVLTNDPSVAAAAIMAKAALLMKEGRLKPAQGVAVLDNKEARSDEHVDNQPDRGELGEVLEEDCSTGGENGRG